MRRGRIIAIVSIVSVAALGAITYLVWGRGEFTVSDFGATCEDPRGFDEAAAYSESGPHPVHIDYYGVGAEPHEVAVWRPEDPATVQLVACATEVGKGDFVERCEFAAEGSGTISYAITLYKGIYDVTLYDARTGDVVFETQLQGEEFVGSMRSPDEPCQDFLNIAQDEDDRESENLGWPSDAQLRDALTPYVEGAAG